MFDAPLPNESIFEDRSGLIVEGFRGGDSFVMRMLSLVHLIFQSPMSVINLAHLNQSLASPA